MQFTSLKGVSLNGKFKFMQDAACH